MQMYNHCRLFPTYKRRHLLKYFLYLPANYRAFQLAASCVDVSVNGNKNGMKEIDFEFLFRSCTSTRVVKRLHALLMVSGKAESRYGSTRLVNLYAHLGDILLSRVTFNQMSSKDAYSWNSMMTAYVRCGRSRDAMKCLNEMLFTSDVRPDHYTFPPLLKVCGNLHDGERLHCWVVKLNFEWDVFVSSALVHMYCRLGYSEVAHSIFRDMPVRDTGCWNAVISGLCQNGKAFEALNILDEMSLGGFEMDAMTLSTILPICAQVNDILRGLSIHLYVIKHGLESDLFVSNALINMYAKFRELNEAQKIFDRMVVRDLVSWNSIIAAYEQNNQPYTAIKLHSSMQAYRIESDLLTLVSLASAMAQTNNISSSKSIHAFILRRSWMDEHVIIGNAVVDMYAKLGIVDWARMVFNSAPCKDVVSWNTMIAGYAQNGLASEAIEVYCMMSEFKGAKPNRETWVSILPAYAHLGALREGMRTHGQTFKEGAHLDIFVGTCLIDLYGKCGRLDDAMSLFDEMPRTSTVNWNVIMSCHGIHGHVEASFQLFSDMLHEGVKPDSVTFLSLLTACSHSGFTDKGQLYFDMMQKEYGIKPSLKHYSCMVDLLGRAGQLEKAYSFIKSMPMHPDASVWGALLGACRIHNNVELGRLASDQLLEVDPQNVGYYVLLSNMYANLGQWEGVNEVRSLARDKGLRKTPGWTSMELDGRTEVFYTGNQSHPQCKEIYKELEDLTEKMKNLGYTPDFTFVLQDVEDDEKEHILTSHSERLAIAFGILNTPPKTTLRIFKNLRVCGDCHNATKLISKITEREIVVGDSIRFHHFKDGVCSCRDFW